MADDKSPYINFMEKPLAESATGATKKLYLQNKRLTESATKHFVHRVGRQYRCGYVLLEHNKFVNCYKTAPSQNHYATQRHVNIHYKFCIQCSICGYIACRKDMTSTHSTHNFLDGLIPTNLTIFRHVHHKFETTKSKTIFYTYYEPVTNVILWTNRNGDIVDYSIIIKKSEPKTKQLLKECNTSTYTYIEIYHGFYISHTNKKIKTYFTKMYGTV